MSDNPYQAPAEEPALISPVIIDEREELRTAARNQKGLLICILISLPLIPGSLLSASDEAQGAILFLILLGIAGAVYVYQLAINFFPTTQAILCGILTIIPGLSLFVMLVIYFKTSKFLRQNGIQVGLLGANLSDI